MIPAWWAHAAALGLVGLDIAVRAVRLRLLAGPAWRGSGLDVVAVNAFGDAAAAVTPARLGGEAARFLGLRRYGVGGSAAIVVLATERVIDLSLVAIVTLAGLGALGERGFRDVGALAGRLVSPGVLPWAIGVAALLGLGGVAAYALRRRISMVVEPSLREAMTQARTLSGGTLGAATLLTAVSMASRVSILPVLMTAYAPLTDPITVLVGSFALIYSQLILPTPAGAGGVELGFVMGFAPTLDAPRIVSLLVAWRVYSLVLPAGLGVLLFVRNLLLRPRARAEPSRSTHP